MLAVSLAPLCVPHLPRHSVGLLATSDTTDGKAVAIADAAAPYNGLAQYITENAKPAKLMNTSLLLKDKKTVELYMFTKSCQTGEKGTGTNSSVGNYKSLMLGKFNNKLSSDCMGPMFCEVRSTPGSIRSLHLCTCTQSPLAGIFAPARNRLLPII